MVLLDTCRFKSHEFRFAFGGARQGCRQNQPSESPIAPDTISQSLHGPQLTTDQKRVRFVDDRQPENKYFNLKYRTCLDYLRYYNVDFDLEHYLMMHDAL